MLNPLGFINQLKEHQLCKLCWCLLFTMLTVLPISAQDQITHLQIKVLNQFSEHIPNAIILVKDQKGTTLRRTVTKVSITPVTLPRNTPVILEVAAKGFAPYKQSLKLVKEKQTITIILEVENISSNVIVGNETLDNALTEALDKNLTQQEIRALPSDPREIEDELKRKYGDDAVIRINGFSGGQLPPKEQIASVKVIKSSFDAEFHTIGKTVVDIRTKAGASNLLGVVAFNFNDAVLNARNTFASKRLPEQNKLFVGYLTGPILKNKSSFNLTTIVNETSKTNDIIAIVPDENINLNTESLSNTVFIKGGIDHNINKTHTLNANYVFRSIDKKDEGVGGLNLPETGFSLKDNFHQVRLFESGVIKNKYVNEFRFEFINNNVDVTPNNLSPSITVLDEFISGGAFANNQTTTQKLSAANNLFFDKANHFLKFGVDFTFERRKTLSKDGLNGSFVFTNIDNFHNNNFATFTKRQNETSNIVHQSQFAAYLQDDVRLYRNLHIGFGLRYELQNNISDKNNFSPRLSFVFSPSKEGRIVLRGGVGLFNHWLDTDTISTVLNNSLEQTSDIIIVGNSQLPPSFRTISKNLVNPTILVAQLGANFQTAKQLNIEAVYKFQRGIHLFRSRNINTPFEGGRPNSSFGNISQVESSGMSTQNSLDITAEGTIKEVSFNTKYKLSRLTDNFNGVFGLPMNNNDISAEYGFSSIDRRHSITGNLNFRLLKRLRIIPVFRLHSPFPYTITTGKDDNGDTVFNDRPINISRNSERGEWLKQIDLRLSSRFFLGSRNKSDQSGGTLTNDDIIKSFKNSIEFNFTVQNVFNTTNLHNYIGNQRSPLFRQPISAATTRKIHFGVNYIF